MIHVSIMLLMVMKWEMSGETESCAVWEAVFVLPTALVKLLVTVCPVSPDEKLGGVLKGY